MSNDAFVEPDFKALFEGGPDLYLVLDPKLHIVAASDAYLQSTMTRRADILGRHVFNVFPDNPDDPAADAVPKARNSFNRVLQTRKTDVMGLQRHDVRKPESEGGGFEVRYWSAVNSPVLNQDGSIAYIINRVENATEFVQLKREGVERGADGTVKAVIAIAHDITERKRLEEELQAIGNILKIANNNVDLITLLKEAVDYLKIFTHCTAVGIRLLDDEGNIPYQAYAGFSQSFYELESPLSIKSDRCMCINVIKGDIDPKLPFYTDGGSFYMNGTTRFLATVSKEDKGQTRNVCNQVGYESVALVPIRFEDDILGLIQLSDPKENMVPLEMVKVAENMAMQLGTTIVRVKSQQALKESEAKLRQAMEGLELKVRERTADLTKANEELVKARDTAEAAVEAKAAFLANMSHELRTPMNAVIGFSNLLLEESLTPDQKDYIDRIRVGGEVLLALINDILDISKMEKKKVELEYLPLSLRALVNESLDLVVVKARDKGLNLAFTINYGTPDTIVGDQGRLRQVLVNLLSNAVKFTDVGEVSVSISAKLNEGNRHQILFTVRDTGRGIPGDKMGMLFQPFSQVEASLSRQRGGTGLGLAISKRLVELMGGEIWVESQPGKGSIFSFTIEAEVVQGETANSVSKIKAVSENLAEKIPLRILVAEDNPSNQKVMVEMLKRKGYRADMAADGIEVLQAFERQPYDLVFMDVRMPEMDGLLATREIRRRWPDNGPKIIAITAYALEGDREKCIEAGMDDYISKPVKLEELAKMLSKHQPSRDSQQQGKPA